MILAYSSSSCYVQYSFIDNIAGSEITSFNLVFRDDVDNRWTSLIGNDGSESLATLHIFSVVKSVYYEIKFRVRNQVGWSDYSPVVSFIAADVPSEPTAPELISFSSTQISLSFNLASIDNGGLPIDSYSLEITDDVLAGFT